MGVPDNHLGNVSILCGNCKSPRIYANLKIPRDKPATLTVVCRECDSRGMIDLEEVGIVKRLEQGPLNT